MATVYSSYSAGWKPSGSSVYKKYRAKLVYALASETDTTVTYNATLYVDLNSGVNASYSGTLNLGGTTYSGTVSSVFGEGTEWLCISKKSKAFTKGETATKATISGGVKSSTGSWTGATVTASASVTIPAKRYSITYDANGGSNAPSEQKKTHNVGLTLSGVIPTKPNYDFVEWNTSSDGTGTSYASGGTLPADVNAITKLYAIWHISYQPPQVSDLRAYRVASNATGKEPNVSSSGTKCYADFIYTPSVDPDAVTNSIKIQFGSSTAINASASGTLRYGYSAANHLPTTSSETVTVTITVTDYLGNTYTYSVSTFISTENYIFDAFKGTNGTEEYQSFSIGGIARDFSNSPRHSKGNFDCYMHPTFFTMAGEIKMWAGDTVPDGWLLCDGSEISKTSYPKLYAAIGDLWGTPNSSSNFKLPNLNGKVPVGYNSSDTDFATVGKSGGEKTHTLSVTEIPAHGHPAYNDGDRLLEYNYSATNAGVSERKVAATSSGNYTAPVVNSSSTDWMGADRTGYAGGGGAHNNMQPYAVIKYIICAI